LTAVLAKSLNALSDCTHANEYRGLRIEHRCIVPPSGLIGGEPVVGDSSSGYRRPP